MKDKDFNRAIRLTRIKVWLQKRFWKWINKGFIEGGVYQDSDHVLFVVQKYSTTIQRIEKELGNIIWLEGYKKRQKMEG